MSIATSDNFKPTNPKPLNEWELYNNGDGTYRDWASISEVVSFFAGVGMAPSWKDNKYFWINGTLNQYTGSQFRPTGITGNFYGNAVPSDSPQAGATPTSQFIYFAGPGTYANFPGADGQPIVTTANLNVISWDGTKASVQGVPVSVDLSGLTPTGGFIGTTKDLDIKKVNVVDLYTIGSDSNSLSSTDASNGVGVVSGINNIPITDGGILESITGKFTGPGICKFSILNNKLFIINSVYHFTKKSDFQVTIPAAGLQTINIRQLGIAVSNGDYLGVNKSSTSQPVYGSDASKGYGWYQYNPGDLATGVDMNYVATGGFAFSFKVSVKKFATNQELALKVSVDEFNTALSNKAGLSDIYTVAVNLPDVSGTPTANAAVFLANNLPATESGSITKVKIRAAANGTAKFQVIERTSFVNEPPLANGTDSFIGLATFVILNVIAGLFEYDVPPGIQIKKGQFLAQCSGTGYVNPVFVSGTITPTGWWQGTTSPAGAPITSSQLIYQTGTIHLGFTVQGQKFLTADDLPATPVTNTITVTRNAANYNSIREIMAGITDASPLNLYRIYVPNGEWFEIDWQMKQFVTVYGQDRDKTIIYMDGLDSVKTAPSDYSFPLEAGKVLSDISTQYKHIVFALNNVELDTLTFKANDGKYCIHLDSDTYETANIRNCRCIDAGNLNFAVGIGTHSGQSLYFQNLIIQRYMPSINLGMFVHNRNNQTKPTTVEVDGGQFLGCGYALIDELGSDQDDKFILRDSSTDSLGEIRFMVDKGGDGNTYWLNPVTGVKEPDPTKLPYNLKLIAINTKIDLITKVTGFSATYPGEERPKILDYIQCDYFGRALVSAAEVIHAGDILATDATYNTLSATKFTDPATQAWVLGVALENNQIDEGNPVANTVVKYAPVGKYALTNVNGTIPSNAGKKLKFNTATGYLETDPTNVTPFAIALTGKGGSGVAQVVTKVLKPALY